MSTATRAGVTTYSGPYAGLIVPSARAHGLDPYELAAVLFHESRRFDPRVVSGQYVNASGDVGVAQIHLPSHPDVAFAQAADPSFAIPWAARDLAALKAQAGGSWPGALRAYNTGSSAPSGAGTAYVDQVNAAYRELRRTTGTATSTAAAGPYVYPLPGGAKLGRLDQGVDFQGNPGDPVVTIGRAHVDAVTPDPGGFGQAIYYTLQDGPSAGQQFYVGHAQPDVMPGETVPRGGKVATLLQNPLGNATAPGWTEIGLASGNKPAGPSTAASVLHFFEGLPLDPLNPIGGALSGGVTSVLSQVPIVGGIYSFFKGPIDATKSIGNIGAQFIRDPAYPFLWLLFMAIGFGLMFIGLARLFGTKDVTAPVVNVITRTGKTAAEAAA